MAFDPYNPNWDEMLGAPSLPGLPGKELGQQKFGTKKPKADDGDKDQQKAPAQQAAAAPPSALPNALANPPGLSNTPMLPKGGDEDMEIKPDSGYPLPSSPRQGTPGDEEKDWPQPASAPADVRSAIVRAAQEAGENPAYALAVASRESSFNPNAGGTGSIKGLFQMTGDKWNKYGIPEGADAYQQAKGFMAFTKDLRGEMAAKLGRDPNAAETYLGHYFGGGRAARMLSSADPNTPITDLFTPRELAGNPNLARAGTAGNAMRSIQGDMERRMATHGREKPGSNPVQPDDYGAYGTPAPAAAPRGLTPQTADLSSLPRADQIATMNAQMPPIARGQMQPSNTLSWDDAVASMPKSDNIEDRRQELSRPVRAMTGTPAERGDSWKARGTNRVEAGFEDFGIPAPAPTDQLPLDAGLNNVGLGP